MPSLLTHLDSAAPTALNVELPLVLVLPLAPSLVRTGTAYAPSVGGPR